MVAASFPQVIFMMEIFVVVDDLPNITLWNTTDQDHLLIHYELEPTASCLISRRIIHVQLCYKKERIEEGCSNSTGDMICSQINKTQGHIVLQRFHHYLVIATVTSNLTDTTITQSICSSENQYHNETTELPSTTKEIISGQFLSNKSKLIVIVYVRMVIIRISYTTNAPFPSQTVKKAVVY